MELIDKIKLNKAKVAVIGLGYVGLPLAEEIQKNGFEVTGIEKDKQSLKRTKEKAKSNFKVSSDYRVLKDADIVIIAVPTPLTKAHEPDLSDVISAVNSVAQNLKKKQLIILESTTYPGTTNDVLLPKLGENGLKVGQDFYLAYSPERIDPTSNKYKVKNIPKLVSGVTDNCQQLAHSFYQQFIDEIIPVSSTKAAEMAKILENIFRSVNVALVNELALLCDRMKIDVWEVVRAASTKPFGFMSFKPGPGLGGHCVPIDPFYLSWKAREYEFHTEFIELAGKVNQNMPYYVVERIVRSLNDHEKYIAGAKVLILGISYKKDIDDVRESPAVRVIELLKERKAQISYHDKYVPEINIAGMRYKSLPLNKKTIKEHDLLAIIANHSNVDYKLVAKEGKLILDTRNILDGFNDSNIVRI